MCFFFWFFGFTMQFEKALIYKGKVDIKPLKIFN